MSKAIGSAAIFIFSLLIIEYLQLKYDWLEKLMGGQSKIIIEDGQLKSETLRSLRMTVDQLEMRLRQYGFSNISDVKFATLEPNGQVGYELMRHAKPIGELEQILNLRSGMQMEQSRLFQETKTNQHSTPIDPKLQ